MLAGLSASGAHGTLIQIVDPAEETFPYAGRVEFVEPEGGGVITAGRAESWAGDYVARVARHRDEIRSETAKLDWLFSTHTTSRSAAELLLFLHSGMMVSKGAVRTVYRQSGAKRMIAGLPLSFAEPLLLLGLLSLPVLWWLLRVMPPRPRRIEFPPTRLLFDIKPKEETPSRTPWWLTLLRLAAAALVILAAAGPIWNPQTAAGGSKAPLVILLDDGWSAASSWEMRIKAADELIANADNDRRGVALVPLSEPARDITLMPGGAARVALRQLAPKPYSIERVETLPAVERFLKATGDAELAWLSDGVDTGRGTEFLEGLNKTIGDRTLTMFEGGASSPLALVAAENAAAKMTVKVLRTTRRHCRGRGSRDRRQGFADRRGALCLWATGPRERSRVRSAGRVAQRHLAAGNIGRAIRRRGATARQEMAAPRHRRRHRCHQRHRAAASRIDLLSHPRIVAVRRRAARRSRRAATGDRRNFWINGCR